MTESLSKGKFGEFKVSDGSGVWKTRTIKRKPLEERWLPDGAAMVLGVPWNSQRKDPSVDGEPPMVVIWPTRSEEEKCDREDSEKAVPRRPQLKKEMFEELGWAQGCPGCNAALLGKPPTGHTEACGKRMEEALKYDPKVTKNKTNINDFLAKVLEKKIKNVSKRTSKRRLASLAPLRPRFLASCGFRCRYGHV